MRAAIVLLLLAASCSSQREIPFTPSDVKTYHDATRNVTCWFVVPPHGGNPFGMGCVADTEWKR